MLEQHTKQQYARDLEEDKKNIMNTQDIGRKKDPDGDVNYVSRAKYRNLKRQLQLSQKQLLELSSVIMSLSALPIEYEKSNKVEQQIVTSSGDSVATATPQEVSISNLKRKIETVSREFERLKEDNGLKDVIIEKLRIKLEQQLYQQQQREQQQLVVYSKPTQQQQPTECGASLYNKQGAAVQTQTPPMTPVTTTSTSPSSSYNNDNSSYTLSSPTMSSPSMSVVRDDHTANAATHIDDNEETTDKPKEQEGETTTTNFREKYGIAMGTIEVQNFKIQALERELGRLQLLSLSDNKATKPLTRKIEFGRQKARNEVGTTTNIYGDIDLIDAMHTKNLQNETMATKW